MKNLPLHIKIVIGLVLGVIWAFLASYMGWNEFTINWIDPFGTIFIRLLKFIAVPLVLFSIISGVSGLKDISRLGKMGGKTLGLYLLTTVAAVGIGLILVNIVKPGTYIEEEQRVKNRLKYEIWLSENNIQAPDGKSFLNDPKYREQATALNGGQEMSEEDRRKVAEKMQEAQATKESGPMQFLVDMVPENVILSISDNKLMLQVIFFAIFL